MDFPRVVYALRHEPTGKVYVGSTHKIYERVREHINCLKRGDHPNEAMQKDFNLHGGEYTVLILDGIYGMNDKNKEYLWMDALQSRVPERGYNGKDPARATALTGVPAIRIPMEAGEDRTRVKETLIRAAREAVGRE